LKVAIFIDASYIQKRHSTERGTLSIVNASGGSPGTFLNEAILNEALAVLVCVTMAFGLIASKMCIEHFRHPAA
jgi:hypothetical protein